MIIWTVSSKPNSCRRCSGSLSLGDDQFGTYLQCLMCGRSTEIQQTQGRPSHRSDPVLKASIPVVSTSILIGELKPA